MKILLMTVAVLVLMSWPSQAFDRSLNPDRYPSIGLDVSGGKLAGMQKVVAHGAPDTDGGFMKGAVDFKLPISNALTVRAFGSSTGINNNKEFTEGNEVGVGFRIYIH